jgi:hypothetical protein
MTGSRSVVRLLRRPDTIPQCSVPTRRSRLGCGGRWPDRCTLTVAIAYNEATAWGRIELFGDRDPNGALGTQEAYKEKQRVGEALARIDAQREKLTGELAELEATERVLTRYSKGTQAKRTPSAQTPTVATKTADAAGPRGRRRTTTAKPAGGKRSSPTLGDQVLALANGKTQQEITAACKGARPNHIGVVIARHKRAGRIEERDGKLYAT